ncbi:MAG: glycosyltransferase family 4 protein [Balneolaceae bacterium]
MAKIVQLSSVHPSFDTRIFHKICKSLTVHGFDVDLIIQHPEDEIKEGVNINALPIARKKSDRIFRIIPLLLKKCFKYPKGTIFHFHDPELIPIGLFLKIFRYKIIYDVHEDVPKDILGKDWIPKGKRKMMSVGVNALEQIAKIVFDHLIVVTPAIEKRLASDNTSIIQNFPILEKEKPEVASKEGKTNVFYIGDLTLVRGVKEIIKAVEVANESVDVNLILAGKFSPKEIENKLKKEVGWKYVNFVGWVDRNDFQKYASDSIAGLVTFHPIPNHIDAQPNKLFEYMYAGLPVIASNFSLWEQIIERNGCGVLVDPMIPEEIAEAIIWISQNPAEAKKMGENGQNAVVEKYNWSQEEQKLLHIYNNLIN